MKKQIKALIENYTISIEKHTKLLKVINNKVQISYAHGVIYASREMIKDLEKVLENLK